MEPNGILEKRFRAELNDVQFNAVSNTDGASLVIAGAGSGKTRVLTYRIAWLLSKGVRPERILALTFTNKAAKEMKERIGALIGFDIASRLWMGTFHSVFAKILRYEAEAIGFDSNFTIYDTQDSKNLVKTIIKELNLDDKTYRPSDIFGRISSAKNNLVTVERYNSDNDIQSQDIQSRKPMVGKIYQMYVSRCKRSNAMDFDDLLLNTNILFRDNKAILEKYQQRFDYVLVDEYQDTNFSQYLIVQKLCNAHKNICVVGDDAQSIYSFRGAKIENILNFRNDYPGYAIYKLEQNYRSTSLIVDAANSVIAKNKDQIQKKVWSARTGGEKIAVFRARDDREEGQMVANQIQDDIYNMNLTYNDFAILYRTNAQSRIFEEALRRRNIPYKVFGSISFYQRKEIKDVLAYYRLLINPNDDEALKRVINYPARGIGDTTVGKLETAGTHLNKSLYKVIEDLKIQDFGMNKGTQSKLGKFHQLIQQFAVRVAEADAYELALDMVKATGILTELYQGNSIEDKSRIENIEELLNGIKEFSDEMKQKNESATLDKFLENVALLTDADTEKEEDRNRVSLMTIHAAKGLEFEVVFIAGLEEDLFPSKLSATTMKEMEEERRLFYVALTRAKTKATLSYAENRMKWGVPNFCTPSRFISDIDPHFIDLPDLNDFNPFTSNEPETKTFQNGHSEKNKSNIGGEEISKQALFKKRIVKKPVTTIDAANFKPDDPALLKEGMHVEHLRFGRGKIVAIEADAQNKKARVFFDETDEEKVLLLKFAKLRILQD